MEGVNMDDYVKGTGALQVNPRKMYESFGKGKGGCAFTYPERCRKQCSRYIF